MTEAVPRLRVIAGPNGSGKSTIKSLLRPEWLGTYVNPDDIEAAIRNLGCFNFEAYGVTASPTEIAQWLSTSKLLLRADLTSDIAQLEISDGRIGFASIEPNSYWASVIADMTRHKLLESRTSLTFETVMSSADKVEFMRLAQAIGFRTYLYFVATEDPFINVARVRHRVKMGGHDVPEDKIVSRYDRSLSLLADAIKAAHRAFIFDNSGRESVLLAEITNGVGVRPQVDRLPVWFQEIYDLQLR